MSVNVALYALHARDDGICNNTIATRVANGSSSDTGKVTQVSGSWYKSRGFGLPYFYMQVKVHVAFPPQSGDEVADLECSPRFA